MASPREQHLVGLDAVAAATTLMQRVRGAHPTSGLFEAADFQWWWARERSTDTFPQLFWFDDHDRPVAAVIATAWGDDLGLAPVVLPGASPDQVAAVMSRGLEHVAASGFDTVELEVDLADETLRQFVVDEGFAVDEEAAMVEAWIEADARPAISPGPPGYRLSTRAATRGRPHHMISAVRKIPDVEPRLQETSLYRADLDLVVVGPDDAVAGYGLFWYDPVTASGLVEPMRTEDDHQGRGLARHVLTAGVDRLARAGADRIKICYEVANPVSTHLYLSAGFVPDRQTVVYRRRLRSR